MAAVSEIEEVDGPGFAQFDVMTDCSDHRLTEWVNVKQAGFFRNADGSVYRKIMQEWKILRENLPKTIYVRAYESRIDLLRAVIIGARGTPYQDGLFFFDIALPEDYPISPPKVLYHSYGLRVNPNLYENGNVCLSLLNTWGSPKCEWWNPSSSTILQVLVSIQGLVLTEEPFYNSHLWPKWAWNSQSYNRKIFALSCKTMKFTLQNPPGDFKLFVQTYFRQHACFILQAIEDYKNGDVSNGDFTQSRSYSSSEKVSEKFEEEMNDLYRMLFSEFSEIGAPGLDNLRPPLPKPVPSQTTSWTMKEPKMCLGNVVSKLKKIFHIEGP